MTVTKHKVKLVEGEFTPAEAADVLFSLIGNKIKFHNLQILSLRDGMEIDMKHSKERIQQLTEDKNSVKDMILQARDEGYNLHINGAIDITFSRQNYTTD